MEKHLMKSDKKSKNKEKSTNKIETLPKKNLSIINHLSMAKTPHAQKSFIFKNLKYERKDKHLISKPIIKMPSVLNNKKKAIDFKINQKYSKNINSNNINTELNEKKNKSKKNNDDKKKILGQIINDFSSNRKLNNNIFDDGNIFSLNTKENNSIYYNNTISNDMAFITYREKDNKIKQAKGIQEITINSFNSNNDTNQLSISTRRGNYYKKRPFNISNIFNNDKNDKTKKNCNYEETSIKKTNQIGTAYSFRRNRQSNINNLNTESILENKKIQNSDGKNYQIKNLKNNNELTYKQNYKENEENNEKNDNRINNINNINNNISLNNRYNFYIKIGKNNKIDINR